MNNKRILTNLFNYFIGILLIIGAVALSGFAQQRDPQRGFQMNTTYAAGGIDVVNVNNGNVVINLPLGSLPSGRGTAPGFTATLQYNSKLWDSKATNYSNHLLQGTQDQNPEYEDYFYTANNLRLSNRSGWRFLIGYNLVETNRIELGSPDPCNGGSIDDYNARWKLEMEFPDGSVRQFIPVYYANQTKDGYYNVNTNGLAFNLITQSTPAQGICHLAGEPYQVTTNGMTYMTVDGSRLRLFVPYSATSTFLDQRNWKLYSPEGTMVENHPPDDSSVGQRISDTNGNKVEIKGNEIVDQLGRSMTVNGAGVTVKGVNGETVTTQIVWGSHWIHHRYEAIAQGETVPWGTERYDEITQEITTVEQVILPSQAGGQSYHFEYNADNSQPTGTNYTNGWGELKSVTFPSGAKADYTYQWPSGEYITASDVLESTVTQRDLTFNEEYDGATTQRTETTYYDTSNMLARVSYPNSAQSSEYLYYYTAGPQWNSGLSYRSVNKDGSFVERLWKYNLPNYSGNTYPYSYMIPSNANAYVKTEFTTILSNSYGPSLTAIKDYEYDKNGNVLQIKEYDWVPESSIPRNGSGLVTGMPANIENYLKRITVNTYYNQAPAADSQSTNSVTYENAGSPKLKNVIKSTEVQAADGTAVSRTEFTYDDPNNKGNLIKTMTWDSTKGGLNAPDSNGSRLNSGNSISTATEYDPYGNPILITDPKGTKTSITYGAISGPNGTVTDLYPTLVKTAYQTAIEQTVQTDYDFYTGLPKQVVKYGNTSAENVVVETEYDAIGRPVKVKSAVNTILEAWTTTEYNDTTRRVVVRSDLETKGDGRKVATTFYDQLGRVRLAKTLEDAATQSAYNETDGIKVQTRYLETPNYSYQLSSNPYRATTLSYAENEPTMGWTRTKTLFSGHNSEMETFSGAGLPAPWGSNSSSTGKIQTDLDANRTLVTDQAGKKRINQTNALGHLTDVWEIVPSSDSAVVSVSFPTDSNIGYGYHTSYIYDTLNNLTQVSQPIGSNGGQTRSFSYSSLSRLLTATNPEMGTTPTNGTIYYQYDDAGNLVNKIDPRGVQTNYTYDALNRVLTRSYQNEPAGQVGTPTVTYTYDDTSVSNSKGKLTKVMTGSTSAPFSVTSYRAFDLMGRITQSQQYTDSQTYDQTYKYNLAGALIEETYPTSGRTVRYTLDSSGDLAKVQANKNANSQYWTYASNFTYAASGAVTSMELGNLKWESTAFNSRLQPTQIALGTAQGNSNVLKLNYDYGSSQNNGNIQSQSIKVPDVGNQPGFTAVQTYSYDSLNRIHDAKENIDNNATPEWKQTFVYDRFGNRMFDEGGSGGSYLTTSFERTCSITAYNPNGICDKNKLNPAISASDNRIIKDQDGNSTNENNFEYNYDNAGNTTQTATGYTFIYDGENKQIEVKNSSNATIGQYWYNGDGKRVKKKGLRNSQLEETIFVYDAFGKLVVEYSTQFAQTPEVNYLTSDNLMTPRINTNENGKVTARHDYQPFGEEILSTQRNSYLGYNSEDVRTKFTGHERDEETNLDFSQARYYSNRLGRFLSVDPIFTTIQRLIDPQRLNLYEYSRNRPLIFSDPNGQDTVLKEKTKEEADARYQLLLKGLKKEDRQYVHLKVGDGKDGYKKGRFYIIVDKDAKSDSRNFQALQKISNDREKTTTVSFLKQEDKYSKLVGVNKQGKVTLEKQEDHLGVVKLTNLSDDPGTEFYGATLFARSDNPQSNIEYSLTDENEIKVWSEQTDDEIVASFFHELRGHVFLSNNGREPQKGIHKTKGVSTEAKQAEDEAKENYKQN